MHKQQVKIKYWEPKQATITLETPNRLSGVEAEQMGIEEFLEKYPEGDAEYTVEEVLELN